MLRGGATRLRVAAVAAAATAGAAVAARADSWLASLPPGVAAAAEEDAVVENWSGTHSASPKVHFSPDSPEAVQAILSAMHEAGRRLRVVGSALSPNGLGLSDEGTRWRRSAEVRARAAQRAAEADAAATAHAAAAEKKAALRIGDAEALTSPVLPQVEELYREGLVEAGCAISAEQIEACTDVVSEAYANYMHAVKTLDLQEDLQLKGFMEIKMCHTGR